MKLVLFAGIAAMVFVWAGCGTSQSSEEPNTDTVNVIGIVEVLHAGTRSETVILTDDLSGEVFALVGDLAYDIIPDYGMTTAVIGRITEEGYSVREDLRKIHVTDYSFVSPEELGDY